ncbi:hypothetical protein H310_07658 [Aphanomyces invadans]|uniref:Uncharacterized protein n=1 Tax=Aphanomyces invadans TaxID=157072 RepID=A0A024U3T1_9STRA|nr:hypothetical protein H310_07658 [Aphanomyces invadans]ETW00278.1 hypothetical protein H310_07658 [Aphanomyces invadans]|eukprot:XP_008871303.1 hypothetical protein H310_07658 [Aphanomyces invadans]
MCRMRQGIRHNVSMSTLVHSNILPPTEPPPQPTATTEKMSADPEPLQPPNLFKEALHQHIAPSRRRKGKAVSSHHLTGDAASLGEQMQHLKQFYEDRVVALTQRCTEAETKLGVLTSERSAVDSQVLQLQALAESQHEKLTTAGDEYASLVAWCREREAHCHRIEAALAAADALNQTLVSQIEALDAERRAVEVEWSRQRDAWSHRQDELDASMQHLLRSQSVLRNDILTKDATMGDLQRARDDVEARWLHLQSVNAALVEEITKLKHRGIALEGQIQMEAEYRKATAAQVEALTEQVHAERRDRQAVAMQHQLESQTQRREFRDRDMACRDLSHRCQRLTNDLVVATIRYEKAEAALEHMLGGMEARKDDVRKLKGDVQKLEGKVADARAAVEGKEMALAAAKRELSDIQTRVVAEEAQKLDALKDVVALNQRRRCCRPRF